MNKILSKIFLRQTTRSPKEMLRQGLYRNDLDQVRQAIKNGVDVNSVIDAPRDRPLHLAVDYADDHIVLELIEAGARVELARHEYPCRTFPLSHYAELAGRRNLAKLFREIEEVRKKPRANNSPNP
ncbi:ankyrin repeat domain-containing protein [Methyloceanibacter methanicus]|uniref:ankyrin repeat domain-containing protein n=1 Tax=Methyloceanibacter methanicus TaxID=1774968 RepID=UPI00114D14D9|nr:ankyrin repeat domain-containing protein [Methyloceanibacter methanicus]